MKSSAATVFAAVVVLPDLGRLSAQMPTETPAQNPGQGVSEGEQMGWRPSPPA
jgi:hypothetical protein